jgi:hypothetical protein
MKLLFALVCGFGICPSWILAQSHTIDFTQPLLGIDGIALKNQPAGNGKEPTVMTLGDAAMSALEMTLDSDRAMTGAEKFKNDELAHKIYKNKAASLTVEEISLIKDRIGKGYSAAVVGPAWRLLDPAQQSKPAETVSSSHK